MRKIKEVKVNNELTLKAFEDKEWNEFKILAFVNGEQIKENDDDASKAYSSFEDDKESILGTLEAEVKFFKANPDYHKKWIIETKEDDDEFDQRPDAEVEAEEETFLKNTDLEDLPENLNQAGFKNVFVIDENTDFSKLPNPFGERK